MMAKANVEPLNCQSWWQAIQCCTCLVHSAAWKPGGLFWCLDPAGSKQGSVSGLQTTPEPSPMDGMRWGWPETSKAWNWTGRDERRNEEERDQNVSIMMSLLSHCSLIPYLYHSITHSHQIYVHIWQNTPSTHRSSLWSKLHSHQHKTLSLSSLWLSTLLKCSCLHKLKLCAGGHFEQQVESPTSGFANEDPPVCLRNHSNFVRIVLYVQCFSVFPFVGRNCISQPEWALTVKTDALSFSYRFSSHFWHAVISKHLLTAG